LYYICGEIIQIIKKTIFKKMKTKFFVLSIALILGMGSCVSSKKYKALQSENENLQKMLESQKSKLSGCETAKMDLEKQVSKLNSDLSAANSEMNKYKSQVGDLEKMNKAKDDEIQRIKGEIRKAFAGLDGTDLQVREVGDKLYVSLPNRVLYSKGSTNLNSNGQKMVKNLADIFKKSPAISVVVEGHADKSGVKSDAPYKDNLELSTIRATKVVRYLLSEKVNAEQLTAAGRSNFEPTGQGVSMDRRIEFIISPDVAKLYELSKKK